MRARPSHLTWTPSFSAEEDDAVMALTNEELDALQFHGLQGTAHLQLQHSLASPTPAPAPAAAPMPAAAPAPAFDTPPSRQANVVQGFPETCSPPTRPRPRLQQIGRIPAVVPGTGGLASPRSFSRPFIGTGRAYPRCETETGMPDLHSIAQGSRPQTPVATASLADLAKSLRDSSDSQDASRPDLSPHELRISPHDFLVLSPRKNSEATTSSGSGLTRSYEGVTAIVRDPHASLVEDEVWDEFNDWIKNEDHLDEPVSPTSSHGQPFQYENYESHRQGHKETNPPPQDSPRGSQTSQKSTCSVPAVSPLAQVNLRVGSMTVSKWLTFGHVIFSPAKDDVLNLDGNAKTNSILVIDGLGNGMSSSTNLLSC